MNPNWSLSHFQAHTSSMCPSDWSSWLGLENKAVVRTLALLSGSEHQGQPGPRGALEEKAQGFPLLHRKRGFPPRHPIHTCTQTYTDTQYKHIHTQHTQMHTCIQTHNTHTRSTLTGTRETCTGGKLHRSWGTVSPMGMWRWGMSNASLGAASWFLEALYFPSFSLRHQLAEPIPLSQGLALWVTAHLPAARRRKGASPRTRGTCPDLLWGWQEFSVAPGRTSHPRPAPHLSPPAALIKDSVFSVTGPYWDWLVLLRLRQMHFRCHCIGTDSIILIVVLGKFLDCTKINPGLPWWLSGKEPACQCRRCRRCGFNP